MDRTSLKSPCIINLTWFSGSFSSTETMPELVRESDRCTIGSCTYWKTVLDFPSPEAETSIIPSGRHGSFPGLVKVAYMADSIISSRSPLRRREFDICWQKLRESRKSETEHTSRVGCTCQVENGNKCKGSSGTRSCPERLGTSVSRDPPLSPPDSRYRVLTMGGSGTHCYPYLRP